MQNRILLIVVIVAFIINLFISSKSTTFFSSTPNIKVLNTKNDEIMDMELDEYIIGVIAKEMPASFNEEALKAQAIASRTYAVYKIQNSSKDYDIVTDVSNQGYMSIDEMKSLWKEDFNKYYSKIKNAVSETSKMVMTYDNKVIEAYYFSMSNGYTENPQYVFSEEKDYLESVEIIYDNENIKNFSVTKEFTKKDICNSLKIDCSNLNFTNIKRSNTNRVNSITVGEKVFKGTEFRKLLNLRSTDFDIIEKDEKIFITTRGYGHGVGMSQYGANGMANNGYKYEEILNYFYKNIEITTI